MEQTFSINNFSSEFQSFSEALRTRSPVLLDSMYVVGSALTEDFVPDSSDINSIIITDSVSRSLLDFLVQLGFEYKENQIAAPLVLTIDYIQSSLDSFPIEFLNFQKIHFTLFGRDRFTDLLIDKEKLRLQCEREIRSRWLWLGQSYLESLGEQKALLKRMISINNDMLPIFRGFLFLADRKVPYSCHETCQGVEELTGTKMDIFSTLWKLKSSKTEVEEDNVQNYFNVYYAATEMLVSYIDGLDS